MTTERTTDADTEQQRDVVDNDLYRKSHNDLLKLLAVVHDWLNAVDAGTSLDEERRRMPDIRARARSIHDRLWSDAIPNALAAPASGQKDQP